MSKSNSLYNGAAWLGISMIFLKILGLIYKVPLSYILDDDGMGYFNSAYEIYALVCALATTGLPVAMSVIISSSDKSRKPYCFLRSYNKNHEWIEFHASGIPPPADPSSDLQDSVARPGSSSATDS